MKIKAAKVIGTCPGRNFATLRITTDEGVHGIVDTTLNGREQAVVAHLEEHAVPECRSTRLWAARRGVMVTNMNGRDIEEACDELARSRERATR